MEDKEREEKVDQFKFEEDQRERYLRVSAINERTLNFYY